MKVYFLICVPIILSITLMKYMSIMSAVHNSHATLHAMQRKYFSKKKIDYNMYWYLTLCLHLNVHEYKMFNADFQKFVAVKEG